MSECCKGQGKLCCAGEPTEAEALAARIAELEEALELIWDYIGHSFDDAVTLFSGLEFIRKWGKLDEAEVEQRIKDAIAYEVI